MEFITTEEWSRYRENTCLIDVRSPSEFEKGHIVGAINIPLFQNDERAVVGTLYRQNGKKQAILKGLDIVGVKMSKLVNEIALIANNQNLVIHCWRGGKRSQSVSWLLNMCGMSSKCLTGGYKAYRQWLKNEFVQKEFNLILLGGTTGSGKTVMLNELKNNQVQIIDLEKLANHKGSAFGSLGEKEQLSNEQFSNELYEMFLQLDSNEPIWLESESKSIGKNIIPDIIWDQMLKASRVEMVIPYQKRVENLVKMYSPFNPDDLINAFDKIKSRLGGKRYKEAIESLKIMEYSLAADLALQYYDKAYQKSKAKSNHHLLFEFEYDGINMQKGIEKLVNSMRKHNNKHGKTIN